MYAALELVRARSLRSVSFCIHSRTRAPIALAGSEAEPKGPRAASVSFFEYGESVPNDDEVLLFQLLLADPPDSVAELDK